MVYLVGTKTMYQFVQGWRSMNVFVEKLTWHKLTLVLNNLR